MFDWMPITLQNILYRSWGWLEPRRYVVLFIGNGNNTNNKWAACHLGNSSQLVARIVTPSENEVFLKPYNFSQQHRKITQFVAFDRAFISLSNAVFKISKTIFFLKEIKINALKKMQIIKILRPSLAYADAYFSKHSMEGWNHHSSLSRSLFHTYGFAFYRRKFNTLVVNKKIEHFKIFQSHTSVPRRQCLIECL